MVFAQVKDKENKSIRIPAVESKKEKDSILIKAKVAPIFKKEEEKAGGKSNMKAKTNMAIDFNYENL